MKTFVLGDLRRARFNSCWTISSIGHGRNARRNRRCLYQFIAVRLPYGVQADEADAQKALAFIQPDVSLVVNIKESADEMVRAVEATGTEVSDFNKGNIKARSRMIAQYALAGARSGAVIGTDHAAENITGFFTKFGDGGADILPLFRLNKRQGKQLLKALGADPALYEKIPTADLEEEKPGIADEVALGVTYNEIDDYLEGKQVSPEAQATIEKWWYKGQHKRHLPITVFDHFWSKRSSGPFSPSLKIGERGRNR